MSDSCDLCGYKNSELKGGGGVSDYGRRITLHVSEPDDLQRDVIKAETASVRPEGYQGLLSEFGGAARCY